MQATDEEPSPSLTAQQATSAGFDPQAIAARLNSADPRNGVYYVYAADGTNGTRQKLGINFDTRSYELTDSQGQSTSGTFSEDAAEPGTYVFASSRITSVVNTARFRITPDAIVGAFPFEKPWSNPVAYQVMPFVAARAFVTGPAQLDGTYNRFGVSRNSDGTSDSQILAMRITGHGATLEMCFDNAIFRIDACPVASKRTYAITASPDFAWTAINIATPSDLLQFRMARIGNQNVWLSGGWTDAMPNVHVFRVGLRDNNVWGPAVATGGASDGRWSNDTLDANQLTRVSVRQDGTSETLSSTLTPVAGAANVRVVSTGGATKSYAILSDKLVVRVGARGTSEQGFISVGLFATQDPNFSDNQYTLFSTNGRKYALALDLTSLQYRIADTSGNVHSGALALDPDEDGSYLFADKPAPYTQVAKFRMADNVALGAYPLPESGSGVLGTKYQPFIAVREFETTPSNTDGSYNTFAVDRDAAGLATSTVATYKISGAGTQLDVCRAATPTLVEQCPAAQLARYALVYNTAAQTWTAASTSGPATQLQFQIAKVGPDRVILQATPVGAASTFRIGLPEVEAWPTEPSTLVSSLGGYGTLKGGQSTSFEIFFAFGDGFPTSGFRPSELLPAPSPRGLRIARLPPSPGRDLLAMQSTRLVALLGTTDTWPDGRIMLGLRFDPPPSWSIQVAVNGVNATPNDIGVVYIGSGSIVNVVSDREVARWYSSPVGGTWVADCVTLGQTRTSYDGHMSNKPPYLGGCEIMLVSTIPGPAKFKRVTFMMQ